MWSIQSHGIRLTLGSGRDVVTLESSLAYAASGLPRITDFPAGTAGDSFDWASYLNTTLTGWDGSSNPFGSSGYIRLVQSGAYTLLQVDRNGTTGGTNYVTLAVLENVTASQLVATNFGGFAPDGVTFLGTWNSDRLIGTDGSDSLYGFEGDDTLVGGAGNDGLIGGSGNDTYLFDTAFGRSNIDAIYDFTSDHDRVALDRKIFEGLDVGTLSASAFAAGTLASDADDRIIYNPATGALLFDADGNGSGLAYQFAISDRNSTLSDNDFFVIRSNAIQIDFDLSESRQTKPLILRSTSGHMGQRPNRRTARPASAVARSSFAVAINRGQSGLVLFLTKGNEVDERTGRTELHDQFQ